MSAEEHKQQPATPAAVVPHAVPHSAGRGSHGRGRGPSGVPMRDLLASCAAADAVSTPPSEESEETDPPAAPSSEATSGAGEGGPVSGEAGERDAA